MAETRTYAAKAAGGEDKLQAAIATGEVQEVEDDNGNLFYRRRMLEAGRAWGGGSSTRVGGSQQITKAMADEAKSTIDSLKWEFKPTKASLRALEQGKFPETQLEKIKKTRSS